MKVKLEVRFAIIPEWVLYSGVSGDAVKLYGILWRHGDSEHRSTPSRKRLAQLLGRSVDTVDRCVKQLLAVGAICVANRTDEHGDPTSNEYAVNVTPPDSPPVEKGSRSLAATGNDAATGGRNAAARTESLSERDSLLPRSGRDSTPRARPPWADAAIEEPATEGTDEGQSESPIEPTPTQVYLAGKITERYPGSEGPLTPLAIARLNAMFGAASVLESLQSMDGWPPARVESLYGYVLTVCQRKAREEARV